MSEARQEVRCPLCPAPGRQALVGNGRLTAVWVTQLCGRCGATLGQHVLGHPHGLTDASQARTGRTCAGFQYEHWVSEETQYGSY